MRLLKLNYLSDDLSIKDSFVLSFVAMSIVFLILILIMFCLVLFKYVNWEKNTPKQSIDISDKVVEKNLLNIDDENMLVASLVAAAVASEKSGLKLRVVNIKEIS